MANLITVNDLKVHFTSKRGIFSRKTETVKAVDSISFPFLKENCRLSWREWKR